MELLLLKATNEVNRNQKRVLFDKIRRRLGDDLSGKKVTLWGLAFKPRTDDMREAPALTIAELLLAHGATVSAYDPVATHTARVELGDRITYCDDAYEALQDADALALLTEWNEFRRPEWDDVTKRMRQPLVFDGRNIWDPMRVEQHGLEYYGIGRGRRLD
ncbi:MAG: UDP binding domain-containing protein [Planctomycetota bacterium]